ncbi:MAG: glycoside hydrolase family 65 protein [Lentisphaerae bacterium]|nr:glycoside hydrolase family 65 protein [Lentisphaerota bacterium]
MSEHGQRLSPTNNSWALTIDGFAAGTNRAVEGLFTLGSGYLHVRGSLEENLRDAPQSVEYMRLPENVTAAKFASTKAKWGTYVPGIYGPHPVCNSELINLPYFLGLCPVVAGEPLDLEHSRVEHCRRTLDLRTATLRRELIWKTAAGTVRVCFERFVSAARPALCVQRMTLRAEKATSVSVRAGLDADVRTNGFDHLKAVRLDRAGPASLSCRIETDGGDHVELETRLKAEGAQWEPQQDGRRADLTATLEIPAGPGLTVEKRTAVTTSRDLHKQTPADVIAGAADLSWEALHAEHAAVWGERWDRADVVIEGDDEAQTAMRVSLYHLLRAHVPGDDRVAIDAKGYAGEAYWGRFFWDTEMYLLPFYLYTDPARARTLVDFRVRHLPAAEAIAAGYGYRGAKYPWESDHEGRECCPLWQYRDHEIHVTADVVYGLAHYGRAADPDYLRGPAARAVVSAARYWLDRVDRRPGDDHPSLLGVMGPNEYTPLTHNSAYTNRLAAFALKLAAEVGEAGGATPDERRAFAELAEALPIPRTKDGRVVLENEDFESRAEPRYDELWRDRSTVFAGQVSQERIYRSKCIKQADVLLLMMLFPHEFTDEEVRAAWDHYVPYTNHDSSLSAGAHAVVAQRLGLREEAWRFWRMSADKDLDIEHGGAAEGIHIAGCGANWQIAVFGFAGLKTAMQADLLTLAPHLPTRWQRLAFPIVWKGVPLHVDISPERCTVTNRGQSPLTVRIWDETRDVPAGQACTVAASSAARETDR